MCYISNLFRPSSKHEQKYDHLTKNEQLLVIKQWKGARQLCEADVNNQMSRKCKEENIMSFLKRLNSLVALMATLRAGFSTGFDVQS